jgi:stage III sporulation protein AB
MHIKWIGSVLIVAGFGGFGVSVCGRFRKERQLLQSMLSLISFLECQLRYQLTPLPDLCRQAGHACGGILEEVLLNFSRELDWQSSPDTESCMVEAIRKSRCLPRRIKALLCRMGTSMGRFDLPGQLQEFEQLRKICEQDLKQLSETLEPRVRTYRTVSLCAGAAAAILLI